MNRIASSFLILLALCGAADARQQGSTGRALITSAGCPASVIQAGNYCPAANLDLTTGNTWVRGRGFQNSPYDQISITRASPVTTYGTDVAGNLIPYAANRIRTTSQGGLIEEGRTNDALWARDMTNAAWVKVNMTAALTATGADGGANSATTLTATAGNATVLETITLGSTADTYSVYLKRVTGTGTVNITINNVVGTTACTLTIAAFTQCSVTATLANPVIGVQIVTNGDVVIADFNQMEPGGFATSPIPTTTVSVARAADNVTATGALLSLMGGPAGWLVAQTLAMPSVGGPFIVDKNSATDWFMQPIDGTHMRSEAQSSSITATLGSGNYTTGLVKGGTTWSPSGRTAVANNGTPATSATAFGGSANGKIGSSGGSSLFINTYMPRLTGGINLLSNAAIASLTQ